VFGVFLNITWAFDNVRWAQVMDRMEEISVSLRTLRIVQNYLQDRKVTMDLKGKTYS